MRSFYHLNQSEEGKRLFEQKDAIASIARSVQALCGFDIIVVDQYLNRIINTYDYKNCENGDIRVSSVVGSIITTKQPQTVYDRRYFADCVSCPNFSVCEVGAVAGCPILSGEECLGAIAYLIEPDRIGEFAARQDAMMSFLTKLSDLLAQMLQNTANRERMEHARTALTEVLDNLENYLAVTDENGTILLANQKFLDFFQDFDPENPESLNMLLIKNSVAWKDDEWFPALPGVFRKRDARQDFRMIRLLRQKNIGSGAMQLTLYEFCDLSKAEYQTMHLRGVPKETAFHEVFGTSDAMQRARMLTENAMYNRLPLLIESRDSFLAERLMRVVSIYGKTERQIDLDCRQEIGSIAAVLREIKIAISCPVTDGLDYALYLHQIEYLPQYLQTQLLELFESSGDSGHVRLIATSGAALSEMVARGLFLRRLFSTLCLNHVVIPELTAAREDLHDAFEKLLAFFCRAYHRESIRVEDGAWRKIEQYEWCGGYRYMRAIAEQAVIRCKDGVLTRESIQALLQPDAPERAQLGTVDQKIERQLRQMLQSSGSKDMIAREMGISRATLYRWIKKYQIKDSWN